MYIQQLYTNCLSEAAYYVESDGVAAIIDPLRDIDTYIRMAEERNAKIIYIFETHFHADFVSGHLDLAQKTGAKIIYGPDAQTAFAKYDAKDGETFPLGKGSIEVIHTPGHTLESSCYLLRNEEGQAEALFTGDTLFVGDVGRPDLFSGNLSKEELASMLYDSLKKLKQLPPQVKVYPAHGPGSSCGKNLGPNTYSTIGDEIESNYALQAETKDIFIKEVTSGLNAPPAYFPINAKINRMGYSSIDEVKEKAMQALSVAEVKAELNSDCILLDTRKPTEFTQGFVPGSVNIGLDGRYAEWAGSLLPFNKPIIIICDEGKEEESVVRLTRVGFDMIKGYLKGGYKAWQEAGEKFDMIIDIEPDELMMDLNYDNKLFVLDVRKETEFDNGHVQTAENIPLQTMSDVMNISRLDDSDNIYIHCAGGYRSVIAASLLKRQGYHNIRNVLGGYEKIKLVPQMPLVVPAQPLN